MDADLALVDLDAGFTLTRESICFSGTGSSPYAGCDVPRRGAPHGAARRDDFPMADPAKS